MCYVVQEHSNWVRPETPDIHHRSDSRTSTVRVCAAVLILGLHARIAMPTTSIMMEDGWHAHDDHAR